VEVAVAFREADRLKNLDPVKTKPIVNGRPSESACGSHHGKPTIELSLK
jgi:hypothetical protein